jgi:hypothetical protein
MNQISDLGRRGVEIFRLPYLNCLDGHGLVNPKENPSPGRVDMPQLAPSLHGAPSAAGKVKPQTATTPVAQNTVFPIRTYKEHATIPTR